jgi:hypothetical protein
VPGKVLGGDQVAGAVKQVCDERAAKLMPRTGGDPSLGHDSPQHVKDRLSGYAPELDLQPWQTGFVLGDETVRGCK